MAAYFATGTTAPLNAVMPFTLDAATGAKATIWPTPEALVENAPAIDRTLDGGAWRSFPGFAWAATGPTINDPIQVGLADCGLMATLCGIVAASPAYLRRLVQALGADDFVVRLKRPGAPVANTLPVRVTSSMPVRADGSLLLRYGGGVALWPDLIEKAVACAWSDARTFASYHNVPPTTWMDVFGLVGVAPLAGYADGNALLAAVRTQFAAGLRVVGFQINGHACAALGVDVATTGAMTLRYRDPVKAGTQRMDATAAFAKTGNWCVAASPA